jgi:hypothetical protein
MTNNVQQAPEASIGMLLFDDDATVTSVWTIYRNKGGSGILLLLVFAAISHEIWSSVRHSSPASAFHTSTQYKKLLG